MGFELWSVFVRFFIVCENGNYDCQQFGYQEEDRVGGCIVDQSQYCGYQLGNLCFLVFFEYRYWVFGVGVFIMVKFFG